RAMAARQAGRRRRGPEARAHGARRGLPLHRAVGVDGVRLRSRLLLVLAYVLVLAVAALLVPLVRSVRDRVSAEVRTQALGQAEVVAATAAGGADPRALVRTSAEAARGRVVIVDARGRVIADSSPGTLGAGY